MNHTRSWIIWLILCNAAYPLSCAQSQPETASDPDPARVEQMLRRQMKQMLIPGLQVAVVHHGKIVLLGAYGIANVEDSVPVTNQTVFPVHSITKAFAGVAIMQLVEAGKLDLSSPVSQYLDGLPDTWRSITIRQLLTHTSGLPDIWDYDSRMIDSDDGVAWAKVLAMPLHFAPGERFEYIQTNYILLGKIIDKISGEPFAQFIAKRQLQVANMPLSGFGDSHDVVPHIAGSYLYFQMSRGHTVPTGKLQTLVRDWPPFIRTATGLNTNAEELARWCIALQQGELLKKESLTTLWAPGLLKDGTHDGFNPLLNGYALGWPVAVRNEHPFMGPTGGGRAALFLYPDDDLTVIVLTNLIGASPEFFLQDLAAFYIPDMRASNGGLLPPTIKAFGGELVTRGFQHASELVNEEKKRDPHFQLPENDMNLWGYRLLREGTVQDAIEVFRINVSLHSDSWNVYDSLAEAYDEMSNQEFAIQNYRRSLEFNPKNSHAVERLKKLETSSRK
jgi:CubicO group peptidase (beta-lactamase class C family)